VDQAFCPEVKLIVPRRGTDDRRLVRGQRDESEDRRLVGADDETEGGVQGGNLDSVLLVIVRQGDQIIPSRLWLINRDQVELVSWLLLHRVGLPLGLLLGLDDSRRMR
jgi:hypothetical protein